MQKNLPRRANGLPGALPGTLPGAEACVGTLPPARARSSENSERGAKVSVRLCQPAAELLRSTPQQHFLSAFLSAFLRLNLRAAGSGLGGPCASMLSPAHGTTL